jgi:hypothetical protein
MFDLRLRHADRSRHYSITPSDQQGWEVRLEEDDRVSRRDHYQDWHRVERAMALFEREVEELRESGWQVTPTIDSQN